MAIRDYDKEIRNKPLESEIKKELSGTIPMPFEVMVFSAGIEEQTKGENEDKGSATPEEDDYEYLDERAVKIEIPRTDTGCEWAYTHDVSVANNIDRIDNVINNGFDVCINDKFKDNPKAEEAQDLIEKKISQWKLQLKTSSFIKNKKIYGFGILKKTKTTTGDIVGLVELDCHEDRCKPLVNLQTGDLGSEQTKGLDETRKDEIIALIQKGKVAKYDGQGNPTQTDRMFYFTRDEIMYYKSNDRGKFKGVSDVKRTLRLVEIKKSFENSVDLIVKRFGPQIWIIVGNKDYNLGNTKIPADKMRGTNGNLIDESVARASYRDEIFNQINTKIQKWAAGETLVQIAEYGVDVKTLTPNTNLYQYAKYIDQFADYIKVGIFGLDIAGRVDVTSALMQDRLYRDLKDKAKKERAILLATYNEELIVPTLIANNFPEDIVYLEFASLDPAEDQQDSLTEFRRSQTVLNYTTAGYELPEYLTEKWEMKLKKLPKPVLPQASQGGRIEEKPVRGRDVSASEPQAPTG